VRQRSVEKSIVKSVVKNSAGRSNRQRSEQTAERRWVGVAVAVLLVAIAVPRTGEPHDDAGARFLTVEFAADPVVAPRVAVSPLDLSRLPPSAFGD
jgi:hypothetical protein